MSQLKKILFIVWKIVALAIAGIFLFYGVMMFFNASPSSHSDWQTYRNEQYGFSFSYPGSFALKANSANPNSTGKNGEQLWLIASGDKTFTFNAEVIQGPFTPDCRLVSGNDNPSEKYNLSGQQVTICYSSGNPTVEYGMSIPSPTNAFFISLSNESSPEQSSENKALLLSILSTFKFTR